ncbi:MULTISPECIES: ABC transporter permease [Pelosinus]|uniref:ABC-type transporter, integral membrane subunit n=1 Tax=Pelosinus fermentans B4 TaxID=1149862 RepID=I8RDV9_9FIRM|nr:MULTISPECIES: ABC transporter permease [Pelosinus]EIW15660.1 ABC-type transporter, integral membrane subunit [Pelosinus fermentans B4]EIW26650.1 ABC-type transporter, integral membrane subunit [Pelosinus fermentans A11]OAM92405.1 ABC-type transporter, integral membrane subunit [Pelosinus fermentans DSM 17108]SDQ43766.1 peptide/nickel transport system permease protein [Pelosinus fermentans]
MDVGPYSGILKYIGKSIIKIISLLIAVSILSFILVSVSPVDPVRAFIGEVGMANMSAENLAKLEAYFGVNTPPIERYWNWFTDFIQGDMGTSLLYRQPVTSVIHVKFMNSMVLMTTAWIFSGFLGFIFGIVAGLYRDRWIDKVIKGYSLLIASMPTFWLALVLVMIFSVWLQLLPIGLSVPIGVNAAEVSILDSIKHLILPALTLSVIGIANITLHTREKMIDIMGEDYILFAKARGKSRISIIRNHALRNIMLPAITLQFASISEIFGGSVLVEQVFSYPGLGKAAVSAGLGGDAPLLLGIAVISAALVFGGNLIANLLYGIIDPRIRRGSAYE